MKYVILYCAQNDNLKSSKSSNPLNPGSDKKKGQAMPDPFIGRITK